MSGLPLPNGSQPLIGVIGMTPVDVAGAPQTVAARMHSLVRGVMARLTVNSTLGAIITLIRPTVVGRTPLTIRGRSSRWR